MSWGVDVRNGIDPRIKYLIAGRSSIHEREDGCLLKTGRTNESEHDWNEVARNSGLFPRRGKTGGRFHYLERSLKKLTIADTSFISIAI